MNVATISSQKSRMFDSDVWVARSAWEVIKEHVRIVDPPTGNDRWPATRFTLVDDDHALMRLAWFSAGAAHPQSTDDVRKLLGPLERRGGFFAGLPLLDAVTHPDARVVERGKEALAHFQQELENT